jgi:mono/diheme cytochrome c family protein
MRETAGFVRLIRGIPFATASGSGPQGRSGGDVMPRRLCWILTAALLAAAVLSLDAPVSADQVPEASKAIPAGSGLFSTYCAVCHGSDAKGTGPLAASLKRRPADLTVMAQNNKGTYDRDLVRRIIDGKNPVKGHGGGDMPVWGDAFERSADAGPRAVQDRLDALVEYLATVQVK